MFEQTVIKDFRHDAFKRNAFGLQARMETHNAKPDRTLTHRGISRVRHAFWRVLDEIFQNIIQKAHDVFDEAFFFMPVIPLLSINRRQTTNGCALLAIFVLACWKHNLSAKVRLLYFQTCIALMLSQRSIYRIGEHHIRLARLQAHL